MKNCLLFTLVLVTVCNISPAFGQTTCLALDFSDPAPQKIVDGGIADNGIEEGDVYLFANVLTVPQPVSAEVTIEDIVDAVVYNLDDNSSNPSRFQPVVAPPGGILTALREGYVEFTISFRYADQSVVPTTNLQLVQFDLDAELNHNPDEQIEDAHETAWFTGAGVSLGATTSLIDEGTVTDNGLNWRRILGEDHSYPGISDDPSTALNAVFDVSNVIRFRLGYFYNGFASLWPRTKGDFSLQFSCLDAEEIATPVKFKSFSATRKTASSVDLSWTTASEQNNRGFNIQRYMNRGWDNVAFVPSSAQNGNSSSDLNYYYTDANMEKAITQYRIQQVDMDNTTSYTEIVAVRGEGPGKRVVVFPNPSANGRLTIMFDSDESPKDIGISDINGKVVQRHRAIRTNLLTIDNLSPGIYIIRITDGNKQSLFEKVVIQ